MHRLGWFMFFIAPWLAAQTQIDLSKQTKVVDFSLISSVKPFTMGATLPGTCVQGAAFFLTTAVAGQNLYGCTSANVWTLQSGGGSAAAVWGAITGTLASQTDLAAALALKLGTTGSADLAWARVTGAPAITGLSVVTSVGSPGSNSNMATEAAVRLAITAASSGVTGPGTTTVNYLPAWGNTLGTSLGVGLPVATTAAASTVVEAGSGGKIDPGWLPPPASSALGGVQSKDCSGAGALIQKINTDGTVSCGSITAGNTFAIQVGASAIGTETALNLIAGSGISWVCLDNPSNNRVDCTANMGGVNLTIAVAQAGTPTLCKSANGTFAYTCSLAGSSALTVYTPGMRIFLWPDVTCSASCMLNINSLGNINIKRADGSTDPGGVLVGGRPQWIWYDGTIWRLVAE